jgi:hypothetical protein
MIHFFLDWYSSHILSACKYVATSFLVIIGPLGTGFFGSISFLPDFSKAIAMKNQTMQRISMLIKSVIMKASNHGS